jgi:hypothetical protein
MAKSSGKGGKKGIGRSKRKPASLRYSQSARWRKNKIRRIVKQMLKFPKYKPYKLSQEIRDKVTLTLRNV